MPAAVDAAVAVAAAGKRKSGECTPAAAPRVGKATETPTGRNARRPIFSSALFAHKAHHTGLTFNSCLVSPAHSHVTNARTYRSLDCLDSPRRLYPIHVTGTVPPAPRLPLAFPSWVSTPGTVAADVTTMPRASCCFILSRAQSSGFKVSGLGLNGKS